VYAHGDRPRAVALMRSVCKDAPEEPRHLVELGDFLVSGSLGERAEAESLWTTLASDAERVTSSIRVEAYERLANVAAFHGDYARVRTLIAEAAKLPIDGNARRQLEAKTYALAYEGPAGAALRGYFFGGTTPGFDSLRWAQFVTLTEPAVGFGYYLLGLQYANSGDWALSAAALDRSLELGLPGLLFVKNAARRLAVSAYRANDVVRVGKSIAYLTGSGMGTPDRLLAKDWQDRLIFAVTPVAAAR
ncbi:MAG: hypothetical protein H0T79_03555, partial [Deltaproteobacteria bacterium]|nr:hypothetical protein [Deltaproteobacteria bacterium]